MTDPDPIDRYCEALSDLRPGDLPTLADLCAPDIVFKDPFNDTRGVEAYLGVLRKMFEDLQSHRFRVLDRALGKEAGSTQQVYLRWRFEATLRASGRQLSIEGLSEITVDADARICRHVDFWDVGRDFYETLPILGPLVSWVRRRAAA